MSRLNQVFERFQALNVLVIGDLMLDAYTWGKVQRISPEAPVPVVQVNKRERRLGGAGNVVLNLAALGAKPWMFSVIGPDAMGQEIKELFLQAGLEVQGLLEEEGRPTTVKERILAGSQQLLRIDEESDLPISDSSRERLLSSILQRLPMMDVLIFEDYDKGVLSPELIRPIIAAAKSHGIPTVVDPKRKQFMDYQGATLFKPNLSELRAGLAYADEASLRQELSKAVAEFRQAQAFDALFLTLSEQGVYMDYLGEIIQIPAHLRRIADVSGAGDTVISIAACALASACQPREIAALANLGGGLVCEHLGVVPIDKERLFQEAGLHQVFG